jgi:hypothetical protein
MPEDDDDVEAIAGSLCGGCYLHETNDVREPAAALTLPSSKRRLSCVRAVPNVSGWRQAVVTQEAHHFGVERPRLFELTSVTRALYRD